MTAASLLMVANILHTTVMTTMLVLPKNVTVNVNMNEWIVTIMMLVQTILATQILVVKILLMIAMIITLVPMTTVILRPAVFILV